MEYEKLIEEIRLEGDTLFIPVELYNMVGEKTLLWIINKEIRRIKKQGKTTWTTTIS